MSIRDLGMIQGIFLANKLKVYHKRAVVPVFMAMIRIMRKARQLKNLMGLKANLKVMRELEVNLIKPHLC